MCSSSYNSLLTHWLHIADNFRLDILSPLYSGREVGNANTGAAVQEFGIYARGQLLLAIKKK